MKLVQYQIQKDLDQKTVKKIYKKFLTKDPNWHFFHEGSYCLIRTTKPEPGMEKFLVRKCRADYTRGVWDDPHQTVRKYQDHFTIIFHGFTLLGLSYKDKDWPRLFNRVCHCFCNMSGKMAHEEFISTATHLSETMFQVMDEMACGRAAEYAEFKNKEKK